MNRVSFPGTWKILNRNICFSWYAFTNKMKGSYFVASNFVSITLSQGGVAMPTSFLSQFLVFSPGIGN